MVGQILMDLWMFNGDIYNQPQIPFLNLFLAATKNLNAPKIIAVVQLLICHVQIDVVAPIVRTTIVWKELTLMRFSIMMMILVSIKVETLMEKQMIPVIVVKTNCLKMMK